MTFVDPDANAIIAQELQQWGLGSLSAWATGELANGASADQVTLDMYQQPAFQQAFQGIFIRQAKGLPAISPADYLSYEDQMAQYESQYGLPQGMLTNSDTIAQLIGNDVGAPEVQARVQQGFQAVAYAPPEVQQAFTAMFGASGSGALAAYFLDPTKALPLLEQQATAASISGTMSMGSINMSTQDAMTLAQMGVTQSQASSATQQLAAQAPLYNQQVGETANITAGTQGVEAQFGLSTNATQQVINAEQEREAQFKGGGTAELTSQGAVGAGEAHPF